MPTCAKLSQLLYLGLIQTLSQPCDLITAQTVRWLLHYPHCPEEETEAQKG